MNEKTDFGMYTQSAYIVEKVTSLINQNDGSVSIETTLNEATNELASIPMH